MTVDDMKFYGILLSAIGSGLGGTIAIIKYGIIPLCKKIKSDYCLLKKCAMNALSIHDIIDKELNPNGGSSIKDALKRIENRLAFMAGKLRAVLSLENEPVWESDVDGRCIWVNHSYLKMTGFDFNYLRNYGWISIINEIDRSRVREEWTQAIADKRIFSCEYTINKQDGIKIKVFGNSYPVISDVDGEVTGHVGRLYFCNSEKI